MEKSQSSKVSRGFTLIELLVVIAIIGILASIILASLSTAENKGRDAKIEEELANLRSQAELYTGTAGAFTNGVCAVTANTIFSNTKNGMGSIIADLISGPNGSANTRCYSNANGILPSAGGAWYVMVGLSNYTNGTANNDIWCVDYTGASRSTTITGTPYTSFTSAGAGAQKCA